MFKKRNFICFILIIFSGMAHAFDLEDYATTYRATRDAYMKAANERKLAEGPWRSSAIAWIDVEMTEQLKAGNTDAVDHLIKLKNKIAQCGM